jgi:hypothetical protein
MHDVEGYTHEEIATALDVEVGTSKAQLSRARAKLRAALADFAGRMGVMTDDRFELLLREAARDYHRPPETPVARRLWARIEAERRQRRAAPRGVGSARRGVGVSAWRPFCCSASPSVGGFVPHSRPPRWRRAPQERAATSATGSPQRST